MQKFSPVNLSIFTLNKISVVLFYTYIFTAKKNVYKKTQEEI